MVCDTIKQTYDGAVERKKERIKKKGDKNPISAAVIALDMRLSVLC